MAKLDLSPQRIEAISKRGEPILISAGAGSGKTTVLVERLVTVIKNDPDTDITDFVIITYTKAAANELRARISAALAEAAAENPSKHLRNQVAFCTAAKIGTIHSFCANLLRQYPKEAGISPEFKIISEERSSSLKTIALDKVLDIFYRDMDSTPGFSGLVDSLTNGNDDSRLVSLVLSLHAKMMSHPVPEAWAEKCSSDLDMNVSDIACTVWGHEMLDYAEKKILSWRDRLKDEAQKLEGDSVLSIKYLPSFLDAISSMEIILQSFSSGWDTVSSALSRFDFPKLSIVRNPEDPVLKDEAKSLKDKCGKDMASIQAAFSLSSEKLISDMKAVAPSMKALLHLTLEFDRQFRQEKLRLGMLDYSDLEHYTFEMLNAHPELKQAVSSHYKEIMVDEYQDVSAIQDAIFEAISDNGRNLFMVGDIKQAIYRFRLADPSIFIKKSRKVHTIYLTKNFRSRKEIIDSVNMVFDKCMSEDVGDVCYDENARLVYGSEMYTGTVPSPKLYIYQCDPDEDKDIFEASRVADEISALISEGYAAKDIAVLLRSLKNAVNFRDELVKRGIPAETSQTNDFFSQPEIEGIINILKTLDNPRNDISLISTMRSCGFTADDLSEIRLADKKSSIYSALLKLDTDKSRDFLTVLNKWRENARTMPMDRLLTSLDLPMTPNLLQFVEMAVTFENDGYHGLHLFVSYLERIAGRGLERSSQMNGNAVHIMSIHKSKGLEYPVVFLSGTEHRFNMSDNNAPVLVHSELGLGPYCTDKSIMAKYPTIARTAIARLTEKETRSEEMRLLYVALTRAKERLFITACVDDPEKLSIKAPCDALCYFDWLCATDLEKVVVNFEQPSEKGEVKSEESESLPSFELPSVDYPYTSSVTIPASVSATSVKNYIDVPGSSDVSDIEKPGYFKKPDFIKGISSVSGTERGSAMHRILQYTDFEKNISEEINRLVKDGFISAHDADIADTGALEAFLSSPLAQRIKAADDVRREFKFLLLVDARELFPTDADEKVLLNGVVDCCFEENGEIVIVDYKTDREDRTEEYIPQVKSYATALSRVFGKPVKEAYLYYLNLGYEKKIGL